MLVLDQSLLFLIAFYAHVLKFSFFLSVKATYFNDEGEFDSSALPNLILRTAWIIASKNRERLERCKYFSRRLDSVPFCAILTVP